MNATVCTGGEGQNISKTVFVTVTGAAKDDSGTTAPSPKAPVEQGSAPASTKPTTGPKAVTDYAPADDSAKWGVAALGGAGLIGAGTLLARRRSH